jgi:hypothetical protein
VQARVDAKLCIPLAVAKRRGVGEHCTGVAVAIPKQAICRVAVMTVMAVSKNSVVLVSLLMLRPSIPFLLLLHCHVLLLLLLLSAGKSREEVKATLKSERAKLPRRRLTHRRRTSRSAHTAWHGRRVVQYGHVLSGAAAALAEASGHALISDGCQN